MAMTIEDVMAYIRERKSELNKFTGRDRGEARIRMAELTALEMHIMARERAGEIS